MEFQDISNEWKSKCGRTFSCTTVCPMCGDHQTRENSLWTSHKDCVLLKKVIVGHRNKKYTYIHDYLHQNDCWHKHKTGHMICYA